MSDWNIEEIPDQSGRTAVVTGANSGLGLVTSRELARKGARVIMACRSTAKGESAASEIRRKAPDAKLDVRALDLSSLESIQAFANDLDLEAGKLDLLINNAGIMMTPQQTTHDGFELQLGTNHLGHFALTGLLLDAVQRAGAGRVVTLSSIEHKSGHIEFDDLQSQNGYAPRKAYQQSKLANALFGVELDRRLRAAGSAAISVLAHPGYSDTNLQTTGPTGPLKAILKVGNKLLAQGADRGALPTLYAATAPGVDGGDYYGPDGFMEMRGSPTHVDVIPEGRDPEVARRLWAASEELTGIRYRLESGAKA
ncbi:MAG: SDR family oxidoreductase [Thermoleophilaceae bacterium]|nr:SDR family oxidoreductase [Thermoleophilaceae bacterium]